MGDIKSSLQKLENLFWGKTDGWKQPVLLIVAPTPSWSMFDSFRKSKLRLPDPQGYNTASLTILVQ